MFAKNVTQYYMVTYKKLSSHPQPLESDYVCCTLLLNNKCRQIVSRTFETDSNGKLHVHYLCKFIRNPYVRGLIIKGYNVNVTPVYDVDNLAGYLNKQVSNEAEERQLLDLVFIKNNYVLADNDPDYEAQSDALLAERERTAEAGREHENGV